MVAGDKLTITKVVMDKGTAESAEAARKLTAPIDPGPNGTSTTPTVEGRRRQHAGGIPQRPKRRITGGFLDRAALPCTERRTRWRKP